MADQERKAEARRPAENFVAKLVPDPASPPDLARLAGYRGASSMEGHVRLYANAELSLYWDIPEADVLHEQPVPADTDPLGAVVLWIKRDSKVVSNLSQQTQGGQPTMNAFTGAAAAAQTTNFPITVTATETFPRTITPVCHSPFYLCPPHSLLPYHCPSPPVFCPPSPLVICHVSPLPVCVQPVSPTCVPTQPPTVPTTIPTTVQTGSPVAQQAAAQAAPQAAAQAFTFGGPTITIPHTILGCHPSPYVFCPPHSVLAPCTIPHSILCHSPLVVCGGPVSPNCTPPTFPTTIPTTVQTGSPVAQQAAAQAAPQAAAQAFNIGVTATHFSLNVHCVSPLQGCFPSEILWQCHPSFPIHCTFTPASPYCTPPTIHVTLQAGSGVAQQAAPQAAAQALTAGATATHFSANVHCVSPLQGCFPSEILWQCHPSYPIHCPVTLPPTVTRTIVTYGTYNTIG
ncbi:MAG: hypothetical protein JST11_02610 [Acidobacteria bacterium]|nr:hypothetical protein [Acidobacteriota bacterium]